MLYIQKTKVISHLYIHTSISNADFEKKKAGPTQIGMIFSKSHLDRIEFW